MIRRIPLLAAIAVSSLLLSASANAQLFRAYLSLTGSDSNPCTLTQPCRLLPAALTAVANAGEVWMLDSANYNTGTVTIGKSVSILAVPGAVGSLVAVNGGSAVNITAAGLAIALRNIVIGPVAGATPGTSGVRMTGTSNLTIEKSVIANLPENGVIVIGAGVLSVSDTMIRNNGGTALFLQDGVSAVVSTSQMIDNGGGGMMAFSATGGTVTVASMSDCIVSGGAMGAFAFTGASATARVSVSRSTIVRTNDAIGAQTGGGGSIAQARVSDSQINDNNNAWFQSGAGSTVFSLSNNQMSGNAASIGTKTPLAGE